MSTPAAPPPEARLDPFDADSWLVCAEHECTYLADAVCKDCELRELRAIVSCVRVVLYGDVCEDAPCEDDECNACRSNARVDAYFRPVGGTIAEGVTLPSDPPWSGP